MVYGSLILLKSCQIINGYLGLGFRQDFLALNSRFFYIMIQTTLDKSVKDKIIFMRTLLKTNAPKVYQLFVAKKLHERAKKS